MAKTPIYLTKAEQQKALQKNLGVLFVAFLPMICYYKNVTAVTLFDVHTVGRQACVT